MANQLPVQLVVTGNTDNLASKLTGIHKQLQGINGSGGSGIPGGSGGGELFSPGIRSAETFQQSLRGLIGRFSALWAVVKSGEGIASLVSVGIGFNATLQDARLGIGALITAQAKLTDGSGNQLNAQQSLTAAMAMGDDQIQKLRISGLQTAATTEQLVSAYQDAVGGGLRAGMSLDQIRKLTVQTVQAAGAMGVPMNQLNQEIRSILDGTIDRNSRVAIRLGITNADVAKWKSAGDLFEKLNTKMAAFSEAGKESMKNWSVMLSNMKEASQIILGDAFKAPMGNIQGALNKVMESLINVDTAQINSKIAPVVMMLKDLGNVLGDFTVGAIEAVSNALRGMGDWWAKNREAIQGTLATFKMFVGDTLSFIGGAAAGLIRFLADSFLWATRLPEPIKGAALALGTLAVSVWGVNAALAMASKLAVASLGAALGKLVLAVRVAMIDLAGLKIAITGLGGPVAWILAAIAAIGAGIYYWATSGERAARKSLELARASSEVTSALVTMGPAMRDLDERMKITKPTELEKIKRDQERKAAIEALIKLAPDQKAIIESQIAHGMALNEVLRRRLIYRQGLLASIIAEKNQEIKAKTDKVVQTALHPGILRTIAGGMVGLPGGTLFTISPDEMVKLREARDLLEDESKQIKNTLELMGAKTTLSANVTEDARKQAAQARVAAANEKLSLLLQDARLDAMPKITAEQRRLWEMARAELDIRSKIAAIQKSPADPALKREVIDGLNKELDRRKDSIDEKYYTQREKAERAFYDFVGRQQGDLLKRRLRAVEDEYYAKLDASRLIVSAEQQAADLAERRQRETLSFRKREVKDLEVALRDLEKTKGRALTFDEQIASLGKLADSLLISKEAVGQLALTLSEKETRRGSWVQGLQAGLLEVANTVEDKFTQMRKLVKSVADGMRTAFSTAIQGMLTGTMSLSQGLKSIWAGITGTIVKAVADMAAQFLVARIAQALFKTEAVAGAGVGAAAAYELAVMESWAAYAGMPFVGWGMAMAQIAAITASYAAVKGMSFAGGGNAVPEGNATGKIMATGGIVTQPTMALIGEAGRELVAPESTFLDWIKNIGAPALSAPAGGYRNSSGGDLAFAPSGGMQEVHLSLNNVNIMDTSRRGLQQLGGHILDALQAVGGQRGQVISPGRVIRGGM